MKAEVSFANVLADFTNVAMYLAEETIVANGKEALRLTLKHKEIVESGMRVGSYTYYVADEILKAEGLE